MADTVNPPARRDVHITDLMVEAMSDIGERNLTRCVIIAMNDNGTTRLLYSNARSDPEMFGMIEMSRSDWSTDADEEED